MTSRKDSILVVEDDVSLRKLEQFVLEKNGYAVVSVISGEEALDAVAEHNPSLVLLDVGLPGIDGFTTCQYIRQFSKVPIIMVTSSDAEEDKVQGLIQGADDYVTKPFSMNVLAARVKAQLRRASGSVMTYKPVLRAGDLTINLVKNLVKKADTPIDLTDTEYRLLAYLARNAGRVVTTEQITEHVWGDGSVGEGHLLHVAIGRLRQKIGDDARKPRYIITRRGIGYTFPLCSDDGSNMAEVA